MRIHAKLLGMCDALMLGLMAALQLATLVATIDVMTARPSELGARST